jgi:hypothetical protein
MMLNFKDFKKIKEDKKEVHMQHPKGHTIIIAIKSLPKTQQEALRRLPLADGGQIKLKEKAKDKTAHYDKGTPDQPISQDDAQSPPSTPTPDIPLAQQEQPQSTSNPVMTGNADIDQNTAYDLYNRALNTYNANVNSTKAGLVEATNGLNNYQAQHPIDADQYRKNMSTPDKISTGIGLFLGGFSVPFGGQNFAQDFLNQQINRNIEAQKANFQNEKNVWGAYQALYHDNNISDNLTKVNELDKMNNRVKQAILGTGTPQASLKGAQLINNNNVQKDALLTNAAHQIAQKKLSPPPTPPPQQTGAPLSLWAQGLPDWAKKLIPTGGAMAETGTSSPQASSVQGPAPSNEVPETGEMPQFGLDTTKIRNSQYLGNTPNPPPGVITPGEVGEANTETAKANQFNEKIPLIHSNFATMWENRSDNNQALRYLSNLGVNFEGAHLSTPDMTTWTESSKNYFRAANRIRQELGALVGNGALTNEQAQTVMTNLIKEGDTPEDYKNILNQVDGNLLSTLQTPVLDKYNLIKRPKIVQ